MKPTYSCRRSDIAIGQKVIGRKFSIEDVAYRRCNSTHLTSRFCRLLSCTYSKSTNNIFFDFRRKIRQYKIKQMNERTVYLPNVINFFDFLYHYNFRLNLTFKWKCGILRGIPFSAPKPEINFTIIARIAMQCNETQCNTNKCDFYWLIFVYCLLELNKSLKKITMVWQHWNCVFEVATIRI